MWWGYKVRWDSKRSDFRSASTWSCARLSVCLVCKYGLHACLCYILIYITCVNTTLVGIQVLKTMHLRAQGIARVLHRSWVQKWVLPNSMGESTWSGVTGTRLSWGWGGVGISAAVLDSGVIQGLEQTDWKARCLLWVIPLSMWLQKALHSVTETEMAPHHDTIGTFPNPLKGTLIKFSSWR